jgi:pimeloyl-ACP methyl ester carboxylesterase
LGAAVAVETALRAPGRVHGLLLDDVALFDPDERRELIARYAPPVQPVWDGTHLNSLWHQLRDAQFFWPWYLRIRSAVRPVEPDVAAARIDRLLFDALRCADRPAAHRAWFEWPVAERLGRSSAPVMLRGAPGDIWARDLPGLAAGLAGRATLAVSNDLQAALGAFLRR